MKNRIKSWLRNILNDILYFDNGYIVPESAISSKVSRVNQLSAETTNFDFDVDGLNLRIYGATGGHILEFRKYDRTTDRSHNKLYLVTDQENFSETVSKYINLELLR